MYNKEYGSRRRSDDSSSASHMSYNNNCCYFFALSAWYYCEGKATMIPRSSLQLLYSVSKKDKLTPWRHFSLSQVYHSDSFGHQMLRQRQRRCWSSNSYLTHKDYANLNVSEDSPTKICPPDHSRNSSVGPMQIVGRRQREAKHHPGG